MSPRKPIPCCLPVIGAAHSASTQVLSQSWLRVPLGQREALLPVPVPPWQSRRWSAAYSWRASTDVLGGGRAFRPVHLPAVLKNDDGTRTGGNPSLMHDVTRQVEIPVLAHVKALSGVAVLEKVRSVEDEMRLALFVSVFGDMQRGGKINHQRGSIALRINAKEREKR